MKPIKISEENHRQLHKLKHELYCRSIDETLGRIFKIIKKMKLAKEMLE